MKSLKQKSSQILSVFFNQFKDYIFPVFCLGCKKEGEWLCERCFAKLNLSGIFDCPVCHKKTNTGEPCQMCSDKSLLVSHIAITKYEENGLSGKVIQTLKYSWAEDVLSAIDKMIECFVNNNSSLFLDIDLIVPVPLHKKRQAERGFNQAELIANILGKIINKPVKNILERNRHTKQQAKLGREDRLKNLTNAFVITDTVYGKIMLVDDVFTTGSTIQECAKVLQEQGVDMVVGFSVARG